MKKSLSISIEKNDIKLSNIRLSMFARLELRKTNKQGKHPIKIRIIYNQTYRDYGTRQNASEKEWASITSKKPKGIASDLKLIIIGLLDRAYDIAHDVEPFTFSGFNEIYLNKNNNNRRNIFNWYEDKIKELKENGQIGTASTYKYSMRALKEFTNSKELTFDKITLTFLKKFENWFYVNGNSPTTVGIYMRPLRHIFKRAIEHPSNFIKKYPFKDYEIPAPKNIKKALTKEKIKSIYYYEAPEGSPEAFYKDIWLFSYFANGINMTDICKLKYSDIKENEIEFRRAKTKRTKKNTKPIEIEITEDIKRIIKKYGTKPQSNDNYIFNFLKPGLSAEDEHKTIKQATKRTNFYIKRVARKIGINDEISTYTARHSFATILKNAGVAPSFIGESMGHASLKTTENYLGSFESKQRKENIKKLKDW